jgi:hypothetical protein
MLQVPEHLQNRRARRAHDARRGRLGAARYDALLNELARVIRLAFEAGATASLWGLEGPLRAGIRSDLCLQGWRWKDADALAQDVLADAFRRVGAVRPSWNEGQPEWTIEAGTLIERTRCARCHKPLPEGHYKFCGSTCKRNHHSQLARKRNANEDAAVHMAVWRD